MKNETKLQLQTLREKSAKQINKLNVELEKDTGIKNMLITMQENLARRKERRKLIAAGLEFDELHDKIRSNKLQKNSEAYLLRHSLKTHQVYKYGMAIGSLSTKS